MKVFFYFFLISGCCFGQSLKFKTITTKDGLSNNSVNDIVSDNNGRLWIATWDGLNLYNGQEFKVFKHINNDSTSLAGNVIYEIHKDESGGIWVLTDNNTVSKYRGNGKFKNVYFKDVPIGLHLSKKGNLMVATESEWFEFDGSKFIKATQEGRNHKSELSVNKILLNAYPDVIINQSYKDSKGNIWYATRKSGLFVIGNETVNIHNEVIKHYVYDLYDAYSFTSNEIEKVYEDSFGNIWLGHKDGGISMAYKGSEHINTIAPHPVEYKHLPNETIRAITKDHDNNLWLGYYNHGIYHYSSELNCFYKKEISKASVNKDWERVRSLYTGSDGTVWAGTYAGLIRYKNDQEEYYTAEKEPLLPANRIYAMTEDQNRQLWIACWGGVARFNLNKNRFEGFKGSESLTKYHIRDILVTDDKMIVATENNGVIRMDLTTGKEQRITSEQGLLGNSVYSITSDDETGYYWIATLGGVTVFDLQQGVVQNISENEGLPSHMVYSVLPGKEYVWISTTKGIAAINKKNYEVRALAPEEGWQAPEFSEGAYFQDSKGVLYFGGINGVNYFAPELIRFNEVLPKLNVEVDGKEPGGDLIEKPYSENHLSIDIIPVAYRKNFNNKVMYKLDGYEDNWNVFSSNPVLYKDLPPGHYQLELKNSFENKNGLEVKAKILIAPPFYKSFWFSALVLLALLSLLVTGFIIKVRKDKRYKERLKAEIKEHTVVVNKQKKDLIKANAVLDRQNQEVKKQKEALFILHNRLKNDDFEIEKFKTFVLSEFKKPLMTILDKCQNTGIPNDIREILTSETQGMVNKLMEWDFLGQVNLIESSERSTVNLALLLQGLTNKLKEQLEYLTVNLIFKIDFDTKWVNLDLLQFKLLFKYLFNDLLKYSNADSSLQVNYNLKDELLIMSVHSDSVVLSQNIYSIMQFSPYFNAARTLAMRLRGKILVTKPKENTTEILIEVPVQYTTANTPRTTVQWTHLNLKNNLPEEKNKILVFSKEENVEILQNLLGSDAHHLIFENDIEAVSSAIKTLEIDLVIVYDVKLNDGVVLFLEQLKKQIHRSPIIYISEDIGYLQMEQATELGVDVYIQLPAGKNFIQAKIAGIIKSRKSISDQKKSYELFREPKENKVLSPNEKLIKKGLEHMHANLHDPSFNVEKLQEKLEVSKIKCYRVFKEVLKQSPSDVIIKLKLQKAKHLLEQNALNISEVSFECGFANPKYFSRQFKKHFGYSPKEHKNQKDKV